MKYVMYSSDEAKEEDDDDDINDDEDEDEDEDSNSDGKDGNFNSLPAMIKACKKIKKETSDVEYPAFAGQLLALLMSMSMEMEKV